MRKILNYVVNFETAEDNRNVAVSKVYFPKDKIVGWEKPFYINKNKALVACKFEKIEYTLNDLNPLFHVISADGESFRAFRKGVFLFDIESGTHYSIYESVESYKEGVGFFIDLELISLEEILSSMGITFDKLLINGRVSSFVRYYWDGVKAVRKPLIIQDLEYCAKHGFSCDVEVKDKDYYETYPTKEECEDDNKIKVIEFKDDVQPFAYQVEGKIETSNMTIDLKTTYTDMEELKELVSEWCKDKRVSVKMDVTPWVFNRLK